MRPLLRVEHLSVAYEGAPRPAPANVSFDVHAGEVVLVLGPSGCGKSTLALALAGLIPHSLPARVEGSVTREGHASEHPAAIVFQDADAQTVLGNATDEVAFGPENLVLPVDEVLDRTTSALADTGLAGRADEAPEHLSGGGRQRLAIAAALSLASPVIVLDEPTANLDPAGAADVYDTLERLVARADQDRALVLVEHDLDEALRIATRVLVLDRAGRLVLDAPPREAFTTHAGILDELGVWLPTPIVAARELERAGARLDRHPLTLDELVEAIDGAVVDAGGGVAAAVSPEGRPNGGEPGARPAAAVAPDPRESADPAQVGARCRGASTHVSAGTPERRTPATAARDVLVPLEAAVVVRELSVRVWAPRGGGRPGGAGGGRAERVGAHERTLLEPTSFELPSGSFTAIVGPNGAGKTTLLQSIAGVRRPERGAVTVAGVDVATTRPRILRDHVGFVFQNPEHQFVTATVRDELAVELRQRGVPEREERERVDAMLSRFALEEAADRHPFLLSGGQKRRLSVGTALVSGASVLVLDEPTFGQDRERARELVELLLDLQRSGTTIVLSTHDLQLAAEVSTHLVVLDGGRVRAMGETREVLASTALEDAGIGLPPLARAMRRVSRHDALREVTRLADLADAVREARAEQAARAARAAIPAEPGAAGAFRQVLSAGPSETRVPVRSAPALGADGSADSRGSAAPTRTGPARTSPPFGRPSGEPAASAPSSGGAGGAPGAEAAGTVSEEAADARGASAAAASAPAASTAAVAAVAARRADSVSRPPLARVNPLAKLVATTAPIVALCFTTSIAAPLAFVVLALLVLAVGARLRARTWLALLAGVPLVTGVLSFTIGAWVDPSAVADASPLVALGPLTLARGAWLAGLATALRLVAISLLAFAGGAATSGADFVRALIAQARVPYRFGYAALAAFRFVPRFRHELRIIRQAHRARGIPGGAGTAIALLAAALRHAERVALAMDSRAFGFAPTRTERHPVTFTTKDAVFVAASLALSAVLLVATLPLP